MMPLSDHEQLVLEELEKILITVKAINENVEATISTLGGPGAADISPTNADYMSAVGQTVQSVQGLLAKLGVETATGSESAGPRKRPQQIATPQRVSSSPRSLSISPRSPLNPIAEVEPFDS
ncbi:hypothetical protein TRVA0_037S01046 [Trichomonascus vanleenenianus]|uniref:uncharacterized protein n=1 Tax=Trichomonascus vanleenenianus TaxID=2268995 RepID=UPI003EC9FAB5